MRHEPLNLRTGDDDEELDEEDENELDDDSLDLSSSFSPQRRPPHGPDLPNDGHGPHDR